MLRYLGLLAALCVIPACSSSSAAPAHDASGPACGGAGHTLAASAHSRLFSRGRSVYGCTAGHRAYRLGTTGSCRRARRVAAVALTGPMSAYAVNACGVDVSTTRIIVRRLTDGAVLSSWPALSGRVGPAGIQSVTAIVVSRAGHPAWIARSQSIISHRLTVRVLEQVGRGVRLLDSGSLIVTSSLHLQGARLSWRHGNAIRRATLY